MVRRKKTIAVKKKVEKSKDIVFNDLQKKQFEEISKALNASIQQLQQQANAQMSLIAKTILIANSIREEEIGSYQLNENGLSYIRT